MAAENSLLAIVELGGYPDFSAIYKEAGYDPVVVYSMRKALAQAKKLSPRVIVAEFNYQSDFRDRSSSLESLMAVVQRLPHCKVIVFYEKEFFHQFSKITDRFPIHASFTFPVDVSALQQCLSQA